MPTRLNAVLLALSLLVGSSKLSARETVSVSGRVTQGNSVGLAAATLEFSGQSVDRSVVTNNDGEFVVDGLKPGAYLVRVAKDSTLIYKEFSIHAPAAGLKLDMGRLHQVHGRVRVATTNTPLSSAMITLQPEYVVESFSPIRGRDPMTIISTEDGTFDFKSISAGRYMLFVSAPRRATKAMLLDLRKQNRTVEVLLEQGGRLEGYVCDSGGAALANVDVVAHQFGPRKDYVCPILGDVTDENGHYSIDGLLAARVEVHCYLQGFESTKQTVRDVSSVVRLTTVMKKTAE